MASHESMTVVRMLARGLWVVLVIAPGCTPRDGAVTTVPGGRKTGGNGGDGASAGVGVGPTEQWMELRERIAEAREGGTLTAERCTAWADELVALHVRHGEPYVGARLEAAGLLRSCDRRDAARERLTEAIEAMPRWARAEALDILGVLAHESGDDGAAIVHLHAALHADPALHEARENLVRILMRIYEGGGSDFARDDIQRHLDTWLELAPDDPRVRVHRARFEVIRARREPEAAEAARREARLLLAFVMRDEPPAAVAADAFVVLARLLLDEGDEASGLRACKRARELDPTRGAAVLLGAPVLLRIRDFEEARRWLEGAEATIDPVDERTRLRLLAVALRGVGRYDEAAEVYERLLSADPPEPIDLYNRAQLERHRLDREPGFDGVPVKDVRKRFAAVVAATQGHPQHAEIERRAKAELRAIDELLSDHGRPMYEVMPEALELEKEERKRAKAERKRFLELEAKARAAREREVRQRKPQ
jgi:tetratricopeptide (TPR) repeat protein